METSLSAIPTSLVVSMCQRRDNCKCQISAPWSLSDLNTLSTPFQTMELAIGYIMKEIFSSYSNTYPFNYLFGDKQLLARQVGQHSPPAPSQTPIFCLPSLPFMKPSNPSLYQVSSFGPARPRCPFLGSHLLPFPFLQVITYVPDTHIKETLQMLLLITKGNRASADLRYG